MNAACVLAVFERYEITKLTLQVIRDQTINTTPVVIGSTDKDKVNAKGLCEYSQCQNNPLSGKYRLGYKESKKLNPDYVMTGGSDSWVSSTWLECMTEHASKNGLVGADEWYICYLGFDRIMIRRMSYPKCRGKIMGNGRVYSKELLEKMNWDVYPPNVNRSLDALARQRAKGFGATPCTIKLTHLESNGAVPLSIKGRWDAINSWESLNKSKHILKHEFITDTREWIERFFPGRYNQLEEVRRKTWQK